MIMNQENKITSLSDVELMDVNGGGIVDGIIVAAITYMCWAARYCYYLGKD